MSNLHGEFLSIHKISQDWPGVPKTQRKVKPHFDSRWLDFPLRSLREFAFLDLAGVQIVPKADRLAIQICPLFFGWLCGTTGGQRRDAR
jgi:hypothetical protein